MKKMVNIFWDAISIILIAVAGVIFVCGILYALWAWFIFSVAPFCSGDLLNNLLPIGFWEWLACMVLGSVMVIAGELMDCFKLDFINDDIVFIEKH